MARLPYADRLAWARERLTRSLIELDCLVSNLNEEVECREPEQDDEDDTLLAAVNACQYACEQVSNVIGILKEGS